MSRSSEVKAAAIPDVKIITPVRHSDPRGFFSETYSQVMLAEVGICESFVQDNHSFSSPRFTLRGLHFQRPPHAQAKLLRVIQGKMLDVVVDLRVNSPWFGKHVSVELSAANWRQVYVPVGFAHGFLTLSEDCEVLYKCSHTYVPDAEGGLQFNDPAIGIDWGEAFEKENSLTINERDRKWPSFSEFKSPFVYHKMRLPLAGQ